MTATPMSIHRPTDAEIEQAILTAITDLARTDDDMVSWPRVRAQLPKSFGYWPTQRAMWRLWQRGDLVHMKVHGTPLVGLADECSRIAHRATELRGEPRTLVVL